MTTPIPGLPVSPEASSGILLSRYQSTQQAIAVRAALAIIALWDRHINPEKFADSWKPFNPLVNGIIDTHYQATAANAAQFYMHDRIMSGYNPTVVPGVTLDPVYLNRITNIMGPGQFFHFLKEEPDASVASGMAKDALRGASTRLVLNGGRDTVTAAAVKDPMARGWERVIEPGACSFCSMLAGRGAVYKSSTVDFRAHDHCHCIGRPVFIGQDSVNTSLSDDWGRVTKGKRGAEARASWDTYWSSHVDTGLNEPAKVPVEERAGHAAIGGKR
jgi:hypothetical protein